MKRSIILFLFIVFYSLIQFQTAVSYESKKSQHELDIILVLDNSGSMKKNDPKFLARDIVTRSLIGLGKNSRLGMVIFDKQARLTVSLMKTRDSAAKAEILESLDRVDYKGLYSDSPAAIERAIYELKTNGRKDALKTIIFMTDGIVDTGDKQRDIEKRRWLIEDLARESKRSEIRIIGIAFTDMADFSLIQALSLKTEGEYFRAYSAVDIQRVFGRIYDVIIRPFSKPEPLPPPPSREPVSVTVTTITPRDAKTEAPTVSPVKPLKPESEEVPQETVQPKEIPPPQKPDLFLPIVLTAVFIFMGAIVIILVFIRKSGSSPKGEPAREPDRPFASRAALLDINNITGKKTFFIDKRINTIGRDPNNDVFIPKDTVSSLHATIEYKDGFFFLEDQRSKNRTSLSGTEIEPHSPKRLKSGDEIMFNLYKFKFILPQRIPAGKTVIDFNSASETMLREEQVRAKKRSSSRGFPSLPQALLIDVKNITGKKTMRLGKRVNKIGRGSGNDIEILEDTMSGFHASIEYRDGFFYLEDQRSKNKTCLGGNVIEPHSPKKLKSGDEIMFDIYKFIFLLEDQIPSGDTGDRNSK